jgi:hypothetical protein
VQNGHPLSWDRECPEFWRRCAQFDENYPENNLLYFPMDEDWTLTPCPNKIPLADRFPVRFTVGNVQVTSKNDKTLATRNIDKHSKHTTPKVPPNQSTMHQFMGSMQRSARDENRNANRVHFAEPNNNFQADRFTYTNGSALNSADLDTAGWN